MSAWRAAQSGERTYYYKPGTNETTWEKPADFDDTAQAPPPVTASQAEIDSSWREVNSDGKTYYWNTATKQTVWQAPEAFLKQQQQEQNTRQPPAFVAGSGNDFGGDERGNSDRRMVGRGDRDHGLPQKPSFDDRRGGGGGNPWEQRQEHGGFRGAMPAKGDEPEYSNYEQAEEAFFKLLRKHNISPDTAWEDALRLVVKEREYRALKDAKDRRAAFEKYCIDMRAQEKSKEKERRAKVRDDFLRMLTTHDEIEHFTRWKTARPIIEREAVFKSASDDDERRQLFDEYVLDLKRKHAEEEIAQHRKGLQELQLLLQALITDPDMKWQDARQAITSNERFKSDETFATLNQLDVVDAFQNHMTALGRMTNEAKQKERRLQSRRERQARDGFRQLMQELRSQGKIKAGTKWSDIQPIIADDERYTSILGNAGSSPLDLFWDVVEEEERGLRGLRNDALDVLEDRQYEMTLNTTLEDFGHTMRSDKRTSGFTSEQTELVYNRLMAKIKKRADDSKVVNERSQRKAIDDLRAIMKHLEPPIRAHNTYEEVAARLQSHEEFRSLDEEGRKMAYDKYIRRQKEKEEDIDRERSRRERDRSERNGSRRREHDRERGDRDRRHRTRTPEIDAYEADRRKAQADRERHYRKASFGLSPPRDRRDDRERDRDDRYRRNERPDVYDRERREREVERERTYVSRADPRDRGKTLDYGDEEAGSGSRPGSVRKRRDSEATMVGDSRRDAKRPRRNGSARTPDADMRDQPADDAPALQSGSEEGEIEEV